MSDLYDSWVICMQQLWNKVGEEADQSWGGSRPCEYQHVQKANSLYCVGSKEYWETACQTLTHRLNYQTDCKNNSASETSEQDTSQTDGYSFIPFSYVPLFFHKDECETEACNYYRSI